MPAAEKIPSSNLAGPQASVASMLPATSNVKTAAMPAARSAMPAPAANYALPREERAGAFAPQSAAVEKPAPQSATSRPAGEPVKKPEAAQNQATSQSTNDAELKAILAEMRASSKNQATPKPQPGPPEIVQPQIQVALSVTQNGIPDQQFATGVMNAIRARQGEMEGIISKIVNSIVDEQARLAYG